MSLREISIRCRSGGSSLVKQATFYMHTSSRREALLDDPETLVV